MCEPFHLLDAARCTRRQRRPIALHAVSRRLQRCNPLLFYPTRPPDMDAGAPGATQAAMAPHQPPIGGSGASAQRDEPPLPSPIELAVIAPPRAVDPATAPFRCGGGGGGMGLQRARPAARSQQQCARGVVQGARVSQGRALRPSSGWPTLPPPPARLHAAWRRCSSRSGRQKGRPTPKNSRCASGPCCVGIGTVAAVPGGALPTVSGAVRGGASAPLTACRPPRCLAGPASPPAAAAGRDRSAPASPGGAAAQAAGGHGGRAGGAADHARAACCQLTGRAAAAAAGRACWPAAGAAGA